MNTEPWKTQQMSQTFLFMTSTSTCKLLVVIYHGPMEIIKYTTETLLTWLYQVLLTVINVKKRCFAADTS